MTKETLSIPEPMSDAQALTVATGLAFEPLGRADANERLLPAYEVALVLPAQKTKEQADAYAEAAFRVMEKHLSVSGEPEAERLAREAEGRSLEKHMTHKSLAVGGEYLPAVLLPAAAIAIDSTLRYKDKGNQQTMVAELRVVQQMARQHLPFSADDILAEVQKRIPTTGQASAIPGLRPETKERQL